MNRHLIPSITECACAVLAFGTGASFAADTTTGAVTSDAIVETYADIAEATYCTARRPEPTRPPRGHP